MNGALPQPGLGPLMADVAGYSLDAAERERLLHPLIGGVILFTRNYRSPAQLRALTAEIARLRPELLIAVDHEGGRVQRFRAGFTPIPAMRRLGDLYEQAQQQAVQAAGALGLILAAELRAHGVDFSFTPVLDLDWGRSQVIGDRAFHRDPAIVAELARAFVGGLAEGGMPACGKHFPGHGWVAADSHHAIPVDKRSLAELAADIAPFRQVPLDAVMPAHVIYPAVDSRPAGFSTVWLQMLRREIGFDGVIFSDDLTMEGASAAGDIVARAEAAWSAGCDMLLVCNRPDQVDLLLQQWRPAVGPQQPARLAGLRRSSVFADREGCEGRGGCGGFSGLMKNDRYRAALRQMDDVF